MNKKLENLNSSAPGDAEASFLSCCGSRRWAKMMAASRPYLSEEQMFEAADRIWKSLEPADFLEAFASHPKIGEKKAAPAQSDLSARWSNSEQSGTRDASETVLAELASANRLYQDNFGFIFIVCATGRTADEMLADCRERLENTREDEILIAAEEQRKITRIRLGKLLEKE